MVDNKKNTILLITILTLLSGLTSCADLRFQKRSTFTLGQNVIAAKFSPDYSTLIVLRSYENKVHTYNAKTFELIGSHQLQQPNLLPVRVEMFANDLIVTAQPSTLLVYQRKPSSPTLLLKQKLTLKHPSPIVGLRLQKLKQDYIDKSDASATRHLAIWSTKTYQVYKYQANETQNKLVFGFDKVYDAAGGMLTDVEFYDDKFMVFGVEVEVGKTGGTYVLEYSKPTNLTKLDAKLSFGVQVVAVKPVVATGYAYYLTVAQLGGVTQFKPEGANRLKEGSQVSSFTGQHTFTDGNNIIGYYNYTSIVAFRVGQLLSTGFPTYTQRLSESFSGPTPVLTIVTMPPKPTGQLITNNCVNASTNQPCFNYYSICDPDSYYTTNITGGEICTKCNIPNCAKCIDKQCVMCALGFFVGSQGKCQGCATVGYGCVSCSQDGKQCQKCDTREFDSEPVGNVCQCHTGNVYDVLSKKCVTCPTKIPFCSACNLQQDNTTHCTTCTPDLNRILSDDHTSCPCNPLFYFQSPTTHQCQLCDPYKKCKTCTTSTQCQQCDATRKWTLNAQSQCVCMSTYVESDNECGLCSGYLDGCKTCSSVGRCDSCDTTLYRVQKPTTDGKCLCESPYTQNSRKVCTLCSVPGCANCEYYNLCTRCDPIQNRQPTPTDDSKCLCSDTFTQNSINQCVLCTTPGCLNCQTENMCTSCNTAAGFSPDIVDGKCQCLSTKYLDTNTCKDCSSSILGCQQCSNSSACEQCNKTLNFNATPVDGSCKCLSNFFVENGQCLQCQVICEHCQKCVAIVGGEEKDEGMKVGATKVGCSQCEDDFQVQDSRCVAKSGNSLIYILLGIGLLTVLIVIGVCYIKRKRATRQLEQTRRSKTSQASLVTMLLKENDPQFIPSTSTNTKPTTYEPLFSGNINYSISSEQRQSDKKTFNETMRQLQRQRQQQYERKNKFGNKNNYRDLSNNININKKKPLTEEEVIDQKKQGLFSHRGKG